MLLESDDIEARYLSNVRLFSYLSIPEETWINFNKNKKNDAMVVVGIMISSKTYKCECYVTSLTKKLIMAFHL